MAKSIDELSPTPPGRHRRGELARHSRTPMIAKRTIPRGRRLLQKTKRRQGRRRPPYAMAQHQRLGRHPRQKTMATSATSGPMSYLASGGAGGWGLHRSFPSATDVKTAFAYGAPPAATRRGSSRPGGTATSARSATRVFAVRNRPASRRSALACSAGSGDVASEVRFFAFSSVITQQTSLFVGWV